MGGYLRARRAFDGAKTLKPSWIPLGVVVLLAAPTPSFAEPVGPGALVDGIICKDDPGQNYALFLPEAYEEGRDWPILYVLDARQNGLAAARLFVPAAKRFGYIVASSNNSGSDSGMEVNLEAMGAIWRDTQARLAMPRSADRERRSGWWAGLSSRIRLSGSPATHAPAGAQLSSSQENHIGWLALYHSRMVLMAACCSGYITWSPIRSK